MSASMNSSSTPGMRLPSQMLALEPRYLFDAAALATAADVTSDPATGESATTDQTTPDSTQGGATTSATAIEPAFAADLLVDNQVFATFENTPAGTELFEIVDGSSGGDKVINTQPNTGPLTYTVTGGTGATAFSVSPEGKILVSDQSQLDFETNSSFTLVVHATDQFGGEDDTTIDILIANVVGEAPDINGDVPDQSVLVGNTLNVDVAALANPDDDDGDPINYALVDAPEGASIDPDTGLFTWDTTFDQAGDTTITVLVSNNFDVDQTTPLQFNVTVEPLLVNISDAATVEEGNALVYTVSLNGDTDTTVSATLGFGGGTASGGATDTGDTDYQTAFYADAAFSTEITSVMLGGDNPTSVNVYVKTFDNDPPFVEPNESVVVLLSNIQNATAGDISGTGTITDGTVEPVPPPPPPPPPQTPQVNTINDATDTGTSSTAAPTVQQSEPAAEPGEGESNTELLTAPEEEGKADSEALINDILDEPLVPVTPAEGGSEGPSVYSELTPEEAAQLDTLIATVDFSTELQSPAAGTPQAEGGDAPPPAKLINEIVQLISACGI